MSGQLLRSADTTLFGEEHAAYRESVQAFLGRHVVPEYDAWGKDHRLPAGLFRRAAEDGFLGMAVPEALGGLGVDDSRFGAVLVAESMEAGVPAVALALGLHNDVVVPVLAAHGSEAVKERWLGELATGELVATLVEGELTISEGGSGPIIDGTAAFVPNGAHAGLLLVQASGSTALIAAEAAGVTVTAADDGIGLKPAGFADIRFDAAVGQALAPDAADDVARYRDLFVALSAAAGTREALELTTTYVLERKVFGVPLASLQNTREIIATMATSADTASTVSESSLRSRVQGELTQPRAATAARQCIESFRTAVDHGVQLHGGYGYILEYPIARAYADAQFWALHGGRAEARRETVATVLLDS